MRNYWQRRPLLIRGAFPDFSPPVDHRALFRLAARQDVESRLVWRGGPRNTRWQLREGPLPRHALPALGQPGWTLLVQGLELVNAAAGALLSRFRFIPDARLDDLMASFATDGGGVGPHVDQYDVFLLQARGRRRWRISRQRNLELRAGLPLKLLTGFKASREWILDAGDMLYLPPGVAHEGVALGDCLTYSIGFRAPAWQELLDPWLARFAETTRLSGRYADPGMPACRHPAALPERLVRQTHAALSAARPSRGDTRRFLLEYLSEPKPQVVFTRPGRLPGPAEFARRVRRQGVSLDLRSRMLTSADAVALNGEMLRPARGSRTTLARLAHQRRLTPGDLDSAPETLLAQLRDWVQAGWLHLGCTA